MIFFFFFKQKTAYEMRISDWSSDVCSSDLGVALLTSDGELEPVDTREPALAACIRQQRQLAKGHIAVEQFHIELLAVPAHRLQGALANKIGRASCRERVCQ